MAKEHYEALGAQLRDARLKHRLELEDIARHLHIRAQYLSALEQGEPEGLPGIAYAKGYLQRYAAFLQLDAPAMAQAFEQAGSFPQRRMFHFPEHLTREREPSLRLCAGGLLGAVALVLIWVFFQPRAAAVRPLMPIPVTAEVLDFLPEACREEGAAGYPACYRAGRALCCEKLGAGARSAYLHRDYFLHYYLKHWNEPAGGPTP